MVPVEFFLEQKQPHSGLFLVEIKITVCLGILIALFAATMAIGSKKS
jgi:hypothetical protein